MLPSTSQPTRRYFRVSDRTSQVAKWCKSALHLVWPTRCASCRLAIEADAAFCDPCRAGLEVMKAACPRCALPFLNEHVNSCTCARRPHAGFSAAHAAMLYGGSLVGALLPFKHAGRRYNARALGGLMVPA